MTPEQKAAYNEMIATLKAVTKRADKELKEFWHTRTDACAKDYARCLAAIEQAEKARRK